MAISVAASGTSSQAVGSTEQSLSTQTTAGVMQFWLDTSGLTNAASPDILEIRIYMKGTSGGTERLVDLHTVVGAQSTPGWLSKPYGSPVSIRLGITQTSGTARAISWSCFLY
jgi:hypothetical protein